MEFSLELEDYFTHWLSAENPISDNFWREFAANSWERKPCTFPRPPQPAFSDVAILRALRRRLMSSGQRSSNRLVVQNRDVYPIPLEVIPSDDELSIAAYLDRVDAYFSPSEWYINCFHLHVASEELWRGATLFLKGLYQVVDIVPSGSADVDVFLGRYNQTPVGVHTDYAANFMFSLCGSKVMRLWDPKKFQISPGGPAPSDQSIFHRSLSHTAVGTTSNVVYMPSAWYHVGETPSEPTMSMNIVLFFDVAALDLLRNALMRRLHAMPQRYKQPGPISIRQSKQGSVCASSMLKAARDVLAYNDVEDEFTGAWVRKITGFGFDEVFEARASLERSTNHSFKLSLWPICVYKTRSSQLAISCNGRSLIMPFSPTVERLVRALNTASPVKITDCFGSAAVDQELVEGAISALHEWAAIDIVR